MFLVIVLTVVSLGGAVVCLLALSGFFIGGGLVVQVTMLAFMFFLCRSVWRWLNKRDIHPDMNEIITGSMAMEHPREAPVPAAPPQEPNTSLDDPEDDNYWEPGDKW